ncbi:MAG: MotA/TolQ/ExbB proton channel family protein, partial [Myxococcales bacterium]|nr:MotA/TolQ/ExbB proton channel family protein [Myxococcales bacterium]
MWIPLVPPPAWPAMRRAGRVTRRTLDVVERALRRASQVEATQLRRFVTFLATTGSTAPFIGLFGTV